MGDDISIDERTIANLERKVADLRAALRPLARPVHWLPPGTENSDYLGSPISGLGAHLTPTVAECRAAARILGLTDD